MKITKLSLDEIVALSTKELGYKPSHVGIYWYDVRAYDVNDRVVAHYKLDAEI